MKKGDFNVKEVKTFIDGVLVQKTWIMSRRGYKPEQQVSAQDILDEVSRDQFQEYLQEEMEIEAFLGVKF